MALGGRFRDSSTIEIPNIIDLMNDPDWFRADFPSPEWDRHRAVLKGALALPMSDYDLQLFSEVAERDPPEQQVKELVIISGRRAGKDSISSLLCTVYAAFTDFSKYLRRGERATIAIIAVDRIQAKICWRYIDALFEHPILSQLIDKKVDGVNGQILELKNGCDITILTNNYRTIRGRSIGIAVLSEVAFYRDEVTGANPDTEVALSLAGGLATLPNSMMVLISSPYKRSGLLYQKYQESYGKNDPYCLVVKGPTLLFNPTIDPRFIAREIAKDPVAGGAEWNADFREDIGAFVDSRLLEAAVDPGVIVRPPNQYISYTAFVDPSGGMQDSFTCCIASRDADNVAVIHCIYEAPSPFNPQSVVADICALVKSYHIFEVTGDRYAAAWVMSAFEERGITYLVSERDRSAIYLDCLTLFTSARIRLLDHPKTIREFAGLERRVSPGGRDRIIPGPAHDDCAVSTAGAAILSTAESTGMATWRLLAEQIGERNRALERIKRKMNGEDVEEPTPDPWVGAVIPKSDDEE